MSHEGLSLTCALLVNAAPLVSIRMWWLSVAWFSVSASVTNILVWTPLLLDAALAGTFDGRIVAPERPMTLKEQVWCSSFVCLCPFVPSHCLTAFCNYQQCSQARLPVPVHAVCTLGKAGCADWEPKGTHFVCMESVHGPASIDATSMSKRAQAWHTSKLALLSGILYVPTALAMLGVGWSSMKRKERRWHCAVPLAISGVAFMWALTSSRAASSVDLLDTLCTCSGWQEL